MTTTVSYLVYANVGARFAGGPEAAAIAAGLSRHGLLTQVIALDSSLSQWRVETPVPFRRVLPRVLDRLTRFSPISLRYVNERILDVFAAGRVNREATILLTSCVAPKTLALAKSHGLTTVFYAKNAFNFYRILKEELDRWGIPVGAGELDFLRRYSEVIPWTDFFISLSHNDAQELQAVHGVDSSRVFTVRNGIDVTRYTPKSRQPSSDVTFVYLGMSPLRKGLPYLLEAWRGVRGRSRLIVAGLQPHLLFHVRKRWGHLPNVSFHGPVNALWLYEQADVYVAPTLAEGSPPRATLEAMACGIPVITTEAGSGGAIRSGLDGLIIPERNVEALQQAMEELMPAVVRQRMGISARKRVVTHYHATGFGEQFAEIICGLADCETRG